MSAKCDRCGVESNLDDAFLKAPKSFSQRIFTYCPNCWERKQHSDSKWAYLSTLATGAVGLLLVLAGGPVEIGWFLINLFCLQLFMSLVIVPHELAHAFTARLVGMKVLKIYLGSGETLFNFRLVGFDCEFKPLPTGGLVMAVHPTLERLQERHFAFILAGPAVNVIMAAAAWILSSSGTLFDLGSVNDGFEPGMAFFYANVLVLLGNLWPRDLNSVLGPIPTDGKQLLQIFRFPPETRELYHAAGFVAEASLFHQKGHYEKALTHVEAGLSLYPQNEILLNWSGVIALDLGNHEKARDCFLDLLERSNLPPEARPILLNNVAYADALLNREDLHEEADLFSQEAIAAMGWTPAIRGTRGTVLVMIGRLEEGLALLRESMAQAANASHKAKNACMIAEAESRLGNLAVARDYLDEARRLDPKCLLLDRAESILQGEDGSRWS